MSEPATVKEGDPVQIHFEGRLPDGTVFETSEGGDPLSCVAGGDEILRGVSQAVIGMTANDTKDVSNINKTVTIWKWSTIASRPESTVTHLAP